MTSLAYLSGKNCAITLAMSVTKYNVHEMIELPKLANKFGVANIHFMWLFNKGNADSQLMPSLENLYVQLIKSYESACKFGVKIDNIEIFKAQVFSIPKTKFDLNNSAWQSITIAPDGSIYPSPALIGESDLVAGNICHGIENVWKNSDILTKVREASL